VSLKIQPNVNELALTVPMLTPDREIVSTGTSLSGSSNSLTSQLPLLPVPHWYRPSMRYQRPADRATAPVANGDPVPPPTTTRSEFVALLISRTPPYAAPLSSSKIVGLFTVALGSATRYM
jgi:hypothetical protein